MTMNPRTAPSIDTLTRRLRASPDIARKIREIILGPAPTAETLEYPKTAAWIRSCHNMPTPGERRMEAVNEVLGTHGVEAIFQDGAGVFEPPLLTYCNAGDTYAHTIVRFRGGRYQVTSWGDAVESLERQGIRVA